ncbi:MAG TPA: SET domain-containing protein-lysine N-methyltransferase [Verrucomicrobiae bacterium]|nr:SET domain-containing protein-lysine N-methyltransferase [Verrucomicrobiae bacterium]
MRDELNGPVAEDGLVECRPSGIHGVGAFARREIPAETRIIEYLGEKIDKQESARRCQSNNVFIFSLNDQQDIDGNVEWNPARLLNHSCSPNCEARLEADRIWIFALRDIRAGEELTFNYGFDLVDYRSYPCQCGSPECIGFIVAEQFFEHVRLQNFEL